MFDDNVYVKFTGNKERYKKRAEELGYKFFADVTLEDKGILILWSKARSLGDQRNYSFIKEQNKDLCKLFGFHITPISEEEFFGHKRYKEIVKIRVVGDKQRYVDRAKALGYTPINRIHAQCPEYLILYLNDQFNAVNYNPSSYKLVSQEEFFGVTMLEKLDLRVLSVLVNLTCETLNSFSAYDVTCLLRSRLPNFNILHEDVRDLVVKYAFVNNLQTKDNGAYLVYTNPVKINFQPAYSNSPVMTTGTTSGTVNSPFLVNANSFVTKLNNLNQTIVQKAVQSKLDALLKEKQSKSVSGTVKPLQSEGRLNLTNLVKEYFPGFQRVYVTRQPNNILITTNPYKNSSVLVVDPELRIRTGFKTNSVNIKVESGKVEITPC